MNEIPHPSPNHSSRPDGTIISAIILHDTCSNENGPADELSWLSNPDSHVSVHLLIATTGEVYRLVDDSLSAWHAGVSLLHGRPDVNRFSIGIELERGASTLDFEPYPPLQLASAIDLVAELAAKYQIPLNRIVAHRDIAPMRRKDPRGFVWYTFLLNVAAKIQA